MSKVVELERQIQILRLALMREKAKERQAVKKVIQDILKFDWQGVAPKSAGGYIDVWVKEIEAIYEIL